MPKRQRVFTERLSSFFPNECKPKTTRNSNVILDNHILEIVYIQHIVTTSSTDFKHVKIFYNFHPISVLTKKYNAI